MDRVMDRDMDRDKAVAPVLWGIQVIHLCDFIDWTDKGVKTVFSRGLAAETEWGLFISPRMALVAIGLGPAC